MENKFLDWTLTILLWVAIGLIVVGILWLFIQPIIVWTDKSEFRLYCRTALLLLAVMVFGVLRLYNSVVQNTRFLVKTREILSRLLSELPNLQRSLGMLGSKVDSLKGTVTNNTKTITGLSDEAREILNALKSNGNVKKSH